MLSNAIKQAHVIPALEARQRFGELLELSYYKNQRFLISRKNKPMAWLVGKEYMNSLDDLLTYIIENDDSLADTLALATNTRLQEQIAQSQQDIENGDVVPLEDLLD